MIRFTSGSLQVVAANFSRTSARQERVARAAAAAGGKLLESKIRQNISLRDHSLSDLAANDHPYARRHGGIRIHQRGSKALVNPSFRVHSQSGTLLNSLRSAEVPGGGWKIRLDTGVAPHAVYVVMGTRVMLGRDVLWDTAMAPDVQARVLKSVNRVISRSLGLGG